MFGTFLKLDGLSINEQPVARRVQTTEVTLSLEV
jgi:hypothetical protein